MSISANIWRLAKQPGRALIALLVLFAAGCETPAGKIDDLAQSQGFQRDIIRVGGYDLVTYNNFDRLDIAPGQNTPLRIYLEGDGSPWRYRTVIMPDPTPRQPLMLRLMGKDKSPAFYIARPCYNGQSLAKGCGNTMWTSGRYSEPVISSMMRAIQVLQKRFGFGELWLFGHSGGGALALLLAQRLPDVSRIVTLAGNLDTEAWIRHHRYTPLFSSLNPATQPSLREDVWQWHMVGKQDKNIPPQLVRPFIMSQPQSTGFMFNRANHGCCWSLFWPRILDALASDDPSIIPAQQFKYRATSANALENQ